MKYKLIATDFDGTLLNDEKKISLETLEVLNKCRSLGYLIVGVTARSFGSVKENIDTSYFDYIILNNGASIYKVSDEVGENLGVIKKSIYDEITKIVDFFCYEIDYCSYNNYYIYKRKRFDYISIKNIINTSNIDEDVVRMNIFFKDIDNLNYYKDFINEKFLDVECFIMRDSDDLGWLVIQPRGISKWYALEKLSSDVLIDSSEIIYFGNASNDMEVIEHVGLGVAVGNAITSLKNVAVCTTLSNNMDGVRVFLEDLIKE